MFFLITRRILISIPLISVVAFFIFSLQELASGDFISELRADPTVSNEVIELYEKEFHLGEHFLVRFGSWYINALTGNFGYSFSYRMPVLDLIGSRLFNTLSLACASLLIAWGLALPFGTISAVYKNRCIDRCISFISYIGMSIPTIFFALILVFMAARTHLFPIGGSMSLGFESMNSFEKIKDLIAHLALPSIVLGCAAMGHYMRQTRAYMIEVLKEDYIRVVESKGASRVRVIGKHAFINILNPLITLFGYSLGFLLSGSFLVEIIFGWPGMARLTIDALLHHDSPLLMASCICASGMLIIGNLIADILLTIVDPRIRIR